MVAQIATRKKKKKEEKKHCTNRIHIEREKYSISVVILTSAFRLFYYNTRARIKL